CVSFFPRTTACIAPPAVRESGSPQTPGLAPMLSRRDVLKQTARWGAAAALSPLARAAEPGGVEVNDVQSQLNATRVDRIATPASVDDIRIILRDAKRAGKAVCMAGGRHAMGGQQFAADGVLIDTAKFSRVTSFDPAKGLVTA